MTTSTKPASFSTVSAGFGTQNDDRQVVLAALTRLQEAVAALHAGRLDEAELILDQVQALGAVSPWVRSASQWLRDELLFSGPSAGRRPIPATIPATSPASDFAFSEREREVCDLVARGFSNTQIGKTLFISASTVCFHLSNMYAKAGVTSRHQLSALCWQDVRRSA